jgi:hypothetical protein
VRTSHELEGHGNSVLIVGHFCGVGISCRGELRGDGLKESWKQARTAEVVLWSYLPDWLESWRNRALLLAARPQVQFDPQA